MNGDARCDLGATDAAGDGVGQYEIRVRNVGAGLGCVNACVKLKQTVGIFLTRIVTEIFDARSIFFSLSVCQSHFPYKFVKCKKY